MTTVTSMTPAPVTAGDVAVTWVAVVAVMVPAVLPNMTALAPMNPVPVMVTEVPPASGPAIGLMAVTLGATW